MRATTFEAATQASNGMVRVALRGELDLATVPAAEEAVQQAGDRFEELVLDLSELSFIDSTGLRFILTLDRRSRQDGDRLRLVAGPPQVQRIFQITGTEARLPFVGD